MNYTKKDLASFSLHLINTNKFKTITIKIVFHTPIIKEEITARNLITDILLQSSEKYETKRDMTIQAEELYGVDISTNNQRIGNYIFTSFNLQVLLDKYTEENNLEKSIEFLSDIIYNPDIKDNCFMEDKLNIVKNNTKAVLDSIKEDSPSYSIIRMNEAYDKLSPISYRIVGYSEDLDNITTKSLYNTYQKMIDNDFVDIFVVGDYDNKEMLMLIKKYFKFKKVKKKKASYYLDIKKPRKRRLLAKETISNSQSNLAIACPAPKLTDYEKNYSMPLANVILGGGSDSKLFSEIREKNSLCYTIHSIFNKLDNMLIISAGIDNTNYQKTVDLITDIIKKMKKGNITKEEINKAKEFYSTYADEVEETPTRMINEIMIMDYFNLKPINERLEIIKKVKKQDIVKAVKKVSMDTIFLLEGLDENN